jgi:hypothetical protein
MDMLRLISLIAVLGAALAVSGCPESSTSPSVTSSGSVSGVAVPSQVNVVTAN